MTVLGEVQLLAYHNGMMIHEKSAVLMWNSTKTTHNKGEKICAGM